MRGGPEGWVQTGSSRRFVPANKSEKQDFAESDGAKKKKKKGLFLPLYLFPLHRLFFAATKGAESGPFGAACTCNRGADPEADLFPDPFPVRQAKQVLPVVFLQHQSVNRHL